MANQIPYLDVQNLTKRFGAQVLFDNISFSIAEGQKVGLVARNGTGKSTLMSVLMDKEGHESGDIIYRRDLATWNSLLSLTQRKVYSMPASIIKAMRRNS